jgi:hypothetical protein
LRLAQTCPLTAYSRPERQPARDESKASRTRQVGNSAACDRTSLVKADGGNSIGR